MQEKMRLHPFSASLAVERKWFRDLTGEKVLPIWERRMRVALHIQFL
jgi:hypothetical protein